MRDRDCEIDSERESERARERHRLLCSCAGPSERAISDISAMDRLERQTNLPADEARDNEFRREFMREWRERRDQEMRRAIVRTLSLLRWERLVRKLLEPEGTGRQRGVSRVFVLPSTVSIGCS